VLLFFVLLQCLPSQKEPIWFPAHLAKDGENAQFAATAKKLLKSRNPSAIAAFPQWSEKKPRPRGPGLVD
jgi:hypothetical protein